MFTKRAEVVVARPREEVFPFVADARNRPSWDENVGSEELTSPEPIGCGEHPSHPHALDGPRLRVPLGDRRARPAEPGAGRDTAGPFPTTLEWEVAEHDGGSLVAFSVTGRPSGGLRLLEPLIARNTAKNLEGSFPRLKQVLESR